LRSNDSRRVGSGDAASGVDAAEALVLGEALAGNADLFVTGDAALLRLGAIGERGIVSPRRFWEVLRAGAVEPVTARSVPRPKPAPPRFEAARAASSPSP
jgi:hypothetical protein